MRPVLCVRSRARRESLRKTLIPLYKLAAVSRPELRSAHSGPWKYRARPGEKQLPAAASNAVREVGKNAWPKILAAWQRELQMSCVEIDSKSWLLGSWRDRVGQPGAAVR